MVINHTLVELYADKRKKMEDYEADGKVQACG